MRPVLISLSPNTEPDDVRLAWRVLFSPWRWRDQSIVSTLEQRLSRYLGSRPTVLTSSGRTAITAALKGAGISSGDEVLIQAFTCLAVPTAITWAGATPIYADIDPDTYNLDPQDVARKITDRTRAIIVQHTFGIPGPLAELTELAGQHNLLLIEDCAHALGGSYNNQPLGTIGDIAILSFGRDKIISSVFGGAVVSSDAQLVKRIRTQQEQLPDPPFWWVVQQLLHPILFSIIKPLYFVAGIGRVLLISAQQLHVVSKAVAAREKQGQPPVFANWRFSPALGLLLQHQLAKLDRYTKRRRAIVAKYRATLNDNTLPADTVGAAWLRFPIRRASAQVPRGRRPQDRRTNAASLRQHALRQGMFLGDWYTAPVFPGNQEVTGYQPGSCPNAEAAASEIVNLPTYPLLTDTQVAAVAKFIKSHD